MRVGSPTPYLIAGSANRVCAAPSLINRPGPSCSANCVELFIAVITGNYPIDELRLRTNTQETGAALDLGAVTRRDMLIS